MASGAPTSEATHKITQKSQMREEHFLCITRCPQLLLDARGGRTVVTVSKDRLQSIDGSNAGSNFSPAFKAETRELCHI